MVSTYRLQEQIAGMTLSGATLERVEDEVIDANDLSPDRKAALWLWALSYAAGDEDTAGGLP